MLQPIYFVSWIFLYAFCKLCISQKLVINPSFQLIDYYLRKVNHKWNSPFYLFLFSIRSLYNINDALKTILSIVARITKANKAWQLSRAGGTYWDNWALSPIIFGRCHDPITIRRGRGALCVEMVLYADISWESRCNIEINVWAHFYKILLVFEVPYRPGVKWMPGIPYSCEH